MLVVFVTWVVLDLLLVAWLLRSNRARAPVEPMPRVRPMRHIPCMAVGRERRARVRRPRVERRP